MKTQIKTLQDHIIKRIESENYKLVSSDFDGSHFEISIDIDNFIFRYSIPKSAEYIVEHNYFVSLKNRSTDQKKIAKILWKRHAEKITKEAIQKKIEELKKQL